MLLISVQPGEEVMESISRQLAERGVHDGAIASLIGAVDACGISNMAKSDHRNDIMTELKQPLEFSGTGEIKSGKLHVHCVVSGEGNAALGGHLHWARVENFFVNAYVIPS
jgi:predicted DNA-binding protein with PD1-like motif